MSTTSKVLVGFIAVLLLVFYYLAARTLKIHQELRSNIARLEQDIEREKTEIARLRGDVPGAETNLRQIQVELNNLTVDRGRVFTDVVPQNVAADPDQGKVTVTIDRRITDPEAATVAPPEDGSAPVYQIDDSAVLYVFDTRPLADSGYYLGQFKVIGLGEDNVVLENTHKETDERIQRIQEAAAGEGPKWDLYETMPADRHDVFAGLSEEESEALFSKLPPEVQEEYRRDGTAAEDTDPPERVVEEEVEGRVERKYARRLRDYRVIFNQYARARSVLIDKIAASQKDLDYLQSAVQDSKLQEEHRRADKTRLEAEKAAAITERDTVNSFRQALADRLNAVRAEIDETLAENKRLAAIWTEWQQNAAREVDDAARQAAPVGAGG